MNANGCTDKYQLSQITVNNSNDIYGYNVWLEITLW